MSRVGVAQDEVLSIEWVRLVEGLVGSWSDPVTGRRLVD